MQIYDIKHNILSDSHHSMECSINKTNNLIDSNIFIKGSLIHLKNWEFFLNFNSNSHNLSFEMIAKNFDVIGVLPFQT